MPANFTQEEKDTIRMALLNTGFALCRESGVKGMTVAELTQRCGIAKGTFYHFFDSKEEFVAALFSEYGRRQKISFMRLLNGRKAMPLDEMIAWYRASFTPEENFLMCFRTEDFVWLKAHMRKYGHFCPEQDAKGAEQFLQLIEGVRPDFDRKVVVNFIKGIYSMTENRDSFFEDAIKINIDLIFKTIYEYMKET